MQTFHNSWWSTFLYARSPEGSFKVGGNLRIQIFSMYNIVHDEEKPKLNSLTCSKHH